MKSRYFPVLIIILILGLLWVFLLARISNVRVKAGNVMDKQSAAQQALINKAPQNMETAIFSSGCSGNMREYFSRVKGVVKSESGFTGATGKTPASKDECFGKTGKAEAVRVVFDPRVISYESLLGHFWELHYPSSLKKQAGKCRASVFYTSPNQDIAARSSLQALIRAGRYSRKLVVVISQAGKYYTAEEYRKICLNKNPQALSSADRKKPAGK
jgi:peptide-methionine (S)-S-oxide reductase